MDITKFDELKNGVQEIIDFIGNKNAKDANNKLVEVSEELDELLDHTDEVCLHRENLFPDTGDYVNYKPKLHVLAAQDTPKKIRQIAQNLRNS